MINIVKWDANDEEFVWKFPRNDLLIGTQLIVKTAQHAIFVRDGQICDEFGPGNYTLTSNNIPVLNKLVNLPFKGGSPFQAEVWFVQKIKKLDNGWGTSVPIQLEDPKYNIIVPIRAFGQFGFTIGNPRLFLEEIVGTAKVFTAEKIVRYFKGKVLSAATTLIAQKLVNDRISILDIPTQLDDISLQFESRIRDEFNRFGVEIINFFFESINVPEDDPSVLELKRAKSTKMATGEIGKDLYKFNRSMDVFEKGAEGQGGSGDFAQAGLGIGMGAAMAKILSKLYDEPTAETDRKDMDSPPPIGRYFINFNKKQTGPFSYDELEKLIMNRNVTQETLIWRKGLSNYTAAGEVDELIEVFSEIPPPIPE